MGVQSRSVYISLHRASKILKLFEGVYKMLVSLSLHAEKNWAKGHNFLACHHDFCQRGAYNSMAWGSFTALRPSVVTF
jgi:hypothetical protein